MRFSSGSPCPPPCGPRWRCVGWHRSLRGQTPPEEGPRGCGSVGGSFSTPATYHTLPPTNPTHHTPTSHPPHPRPPTNHTLTSPQPPSPPTNFTHTLTPHQPHPHFPPLDTPSPPTNFTHTLPQPPSSPTKFTHTLTPHQSHPCLLATHQLHPPHVHVTPSESAVQPHLHAPPFGDSTT